MQYLATALPAHARGAWLRRCARLFTRRFHIGGAISVTAVSRNEMRRLNRLYRKKNKPTDVLSFLLEQPPRGRRATSAPFGEIILCLPVVKEKARLRKRTAGVELRALVIHATLHLLGYDHERERDAVRMEALETEMLQALSGRLAI